MGSICYTCKKKLGWGKIKYTHPDIISAHPTIVPVGFTSEDILCEDCMQNLHKQVPDYVSEDEIYTEPNSEYNTKNQKDCSLVRNSDEICLVYFEISSIKLNGEFIDQNLFSLNSSNPFFYQFLTWKKSKFRKEAKLFSRFWFGTPPSEWDTSTWTEDYGSFDKFLTFQFDSKTGKLIIVTNGISKNVNRFEIQLKFANQALVLARFLLFTNLRKKKINDKTIKEIKLKNNSKKIKLEKNSNELHEHEEVLAEFFKSNRTRYDNDSQIITDYVIFRITNFKIINDVWYTPLCFIQNNNDVSEKSKEDIMNDIQENSIFNFTHDEYDDVIASNVKQTTSSTGFRTGGVNAVSVYGFGVNQDTHSYEGMSTGNESGDIIFMSKGKKICTWENFQDPKGIVDMIKSAKSQFESQDEKIPEPVISSSDDDPLKILKIRLAKGEITLEEFNKIKENLV
jgi:hypothetical protein